ncbi:Ras-related protein Rab11A [Tritrichomonas foetus]|uniref:Ras-related protein Rab11A n=1 Tax=Tritrichomonas foetus TaxID=1144522 RepID=A0A1J4KFU3_9EUKA|nr:Ras-related protein Rab11A [Tritrichomonas foetus]|eukprot:OHT10287.1 Ras-related protein Rab11A [Tritrichomonas foetus]
MQSDYPTYKIIMVGDVAVGKTSIIHRYLNGDFNLQEPATVASKLNFEKLVNAEHGSFYLSLWDTAGSERYRSMTRQYYRNANTAIVVYALDNPDSMNNVGSWIKDLQDNSEKVNIIVCGAKCDIVTEEEANRMNEEVMKKYDQSVKAFFITSACTNQNIEEMFEYIISEVFTGNQVPEVIPLAENKKCNC